MNCPNCGAQNAGNNRFCLECGYKLPDPAPFQQQQSSQVPNSYYFTRKNYLANLHPVTLAGIVGIASSVLILLGWVTPWFRLSGIMDKILDLMDVGSGYDILDFGGGIGSGLQMALLLLLMCFAAFVAGESELIFIGFLGLIPFAVLIAIPIFAVLMIRRSIKLFDEKSVGMVNNNWGPALISETTQKIKSYSSKVFIIMAVLFVIFVSIPFGARFLGSGFYLVIIGSIVGYAGAILTQNKIRSII